MAPLNVAIVGGGISGLYTALLLQREGHCVRIFEGTGRIGGRVCTHYFTTEKDQYFEAGAMRIPNSDFHKIVFDLVDHLNSRVSEDKKIELIKYVLTAPGNSIYINGHRPDIEVSASTPALVGWDVPDEYKDKSAQELLREAIGGFIDDLKNDFETAFGEIVEKFDNYTFRLYCTSVMGWPDEVIDFVETVTSQTNQFSLSVPELVMQNMDFDETDWRTIDRGMSRLPQAMVDLVGYDNITFGARVTGLDEIDEGVRVTATGYNGTVSADFDRVVLAIPPAALRMIARRPTWSVRKEMAIRSMHFEALYKMGMRFKERFWEKMGRSSSEGGQSTTDLPIRWIVFPSNGIGEDGPGVLLIYAWMTDASNWLPLSPLERRSLALECLAKMYETVNVHDLLIETSDAVWSQSTATGDAMFLPGQFRTRFDVARQPERGVFFAGEHLSYHHTWISGAADSALRAVRDMLGEPDLPPLGGPRGGAEERSGADVGREDAGGASDVRSAARKPVLGSLGRLPELSKVPFEFRLDRPMYGGGDPSRPFRRWTPGKNADSEYNFPTHLGVSGISLCGEMTSLKAVNSVGLIF